MPFPGAVKKNSENASFELTGSQIFLENIGSLERWINRFKADEPEVSFYQIHLSHVQFISGSLARTEMPEHSLSGATVEQNVWKEGPTDVAITQMSSTNGFNVPLNFKNQEESPERQLAALKGALLSLLTQSYTWNSIELDHVFFHTDRQIDYAATEHFYSDLLSALAKNDSLRELTIKPLPLAKYRNSLANFLAQNTQLETLHLEISEANRKDWLELSQILAMHSKLKSFNLGQSILDANAYSALASLLDENYRVEIILLEPANENLLKAFEPLKQRLSKTGLVRFKEDHLSQATLLHVAITALESLQKLKSSAINQINQSKKQALLEKQFDFLLLNQGQLAVTSREKDDWVKSAEVLPNIYKDHEEYLKQESSLVQLHVDQLVTGENKTVGYVLLEKALEVENLSAMQTLLKAKANLFELPASNEEPFLVKILQSKGDLKRVVIDFIREHHLVERASDYLEAYSQLIAAPKELKTHLDEHSAHRIKKGNQILLVLLAKEAVRFSRKLSGLQNPSDKRGKESAKIYLDLDKSLEVFNNTPEVTYGALRQVQVIMQRIKEDSMKALRKLLNTSSLHEKVIEVVNRFDEALEASKKNINDKKDEMIKEITESRERERAEFNTKLVKLEAKHAAMEAKLNILLRQMAANSVQAPKVVTSQSQERPEISTSFFAKL